MNKIVRKDSYISAFLLLGGFGVYQMKSGMTDTYALNEYHNIAF